MHTHDVTNSVPAFLIKLWKLVEDSSCDDLIAWSDSGISFIIKDQARFASELLPQYFKHNNMASFVRQLNMYGFRKVMNYEKSGLRNENNEMEFHHPFFLKEQSELLELIKRKIPNTRIVAEPQTRSDAKDILTDLTSIRDKQESMDNMLLKMKQENELLWKELTNMRQKHKQQEQVIEKVIHFLVQVIRNQPIGVGFQRNLPKMLHDSPGSKANITTLDVLRNNPECVMVKNKTSSGPVIHEVTECEVEEPLSVGSVNSSSAKSPLPSSTKSYIHSLSPGVVTLSPSTPCDSEQVIHAQDSSQLNSSNLNSPGDSSVPFEPLSILEPLQSRAHVLDDDEYSNAESVLGIPLEYITAADVASSINTAPLEKNIVKRVTKPKKDYLKVSNVKNKNGKNVMSVPENNHLNNVIAIPKGIDIGNVISIPEGSDIANVISIPENSDIANIISIPEGSDISNIINIPDGTVISIPEGSKISDIITVPDANNKSQTRTVSKISKNNNISSKSTATASKNLSRKKPPLSIIYPGFLEPTCLDDLKPNEMQSTTSSLSKQDYVDPLMTDSLQTPKVSLPEDLDFVDYTGKNNKQTDSDAEYLNPMSIIQEHDYPASISDPNKGKSSSAKNTLSNHLLIVDEELNRLQDNITTNSWDVDVDKILGLFSSDGIVSNDSLVDQLTSGLEVKKEPCDILDSELGQLTPQILGVELDELRSPFLSQIDPEVVDSGGFDFESAKTNLTSHIMNQSDFSTMELNSESDVINSSGRRRKNSQGTRGKRRKLR